MSDGNNDNDESQISYTNFNEPSKDNELCDCWDKIQDLIDNVNELDGDVKICIE